MSREPAPTRAPFAALVPCSAAWAADRARGPHTRKDAA